VRCPRCRTENLADALFCEECGAAFERTCGTCGTTARASAKFCRGCGAALGGGAPAHAERAPAAYTPRHLAERILTTRAALEGERKQVTVLFADVKGSLELAEQVDPEEWHGILDHFFAILADGVHRFEGTVNQFTGDGVMALFGAPLAHEDHAQRACWAALHLREELRRYADALRVERGLNFSVRIGLNSGEVVVGRIGDDLRMDYTAQGHAVGLAARMEQLAEPGHVYLTEHTAALGAGWFRLQDLGRASVRGAQEPVGVFRLEGPGTVRSRLDRSRVRGLSRFVGRVEETATLEAALERSLAGDGQVVGVVAEAGTGKSRLCDELVQRCRARGITVYEGRGVSHGRLVPFLPVLAMFRTFCGVTEEDSAQAAREKIAGRLLLLDDGLRDGLPLLFDFLGVPDPARPAPRMDPEARQRQLLEATRRLVARQCGREPSVTVLEDLQWFDVGSGAFLDVFVEATAGSRHLLLLNFRPEYRAAWMQAPHYTEIALPPLGAEAIGALLHDLLGDDPSLGDLGRRIEARCGGNPFFLEEIVATLVERGWLAGTRGAYRLAGVVDDAALPPTVQALLAARIDRRPEHEKEVLQTAAVLGREFAEPVLRRVLGPSAGPLAGALDALVAAGFVHQTALFPEAEYAFRHPLTHEVTYRSQLKERRERTHAAAARVIAELRADRLDEHAGVLAHHWEGAGEPLEAARWHARAAAWAGLSNADESLGHWRRVRALVRDLPPSAETGALAVGASAQLLNLGWRCGGSPDEAAEIFAEGMALAERAGDRCALAGLHGVYGAVRGLSGDEDAFVRHVAEGLRLAEAAGDEQLVQDLLSALTAAYDSAGQSARALAVADRALGYPPRSGVSAFGFNSLAFATGKRGDLLTYVSRPLEGRRDIERAQALAEDAGDAETLYMAHAWHAFNAWIVCEPERALAHGRAAFELVERTGSSFGRSFSRNALATALTITGRPDEAVELYEASIALIRERGANAQIEAHTLASLAEANLLAGRLAEATRFAEEATAIATRRRGRFRAPFIRIALARVLRATAGADARERIAAALDAADQLVAATGVTSYAPFVLVERAAFRRLVGDAAGADAVAAEARRLFLAMGAPARAAAVEEVAWSAANRAS
jgi:class 3 adenylate cyclase/tetratricopeptide (TPR) repeat protein